MLQKSHFDEQQETDLLTVHLFHCLYQFADRTMSVHRWESSRDEQTAIRDDDEEVQDNAKPMHGFLLLKLLRQFQREAGVPVNKTI